MHLAQHWIRMAFRVLSGVLNRRWLEVLQSSQVRDSPTRWDNRRLSSYLQGVVTASFLQRVLQDNITDDDTFQANSPSGDSNTLWTLSHFDIRNAVPGLQHKFCALWNEIVLKAMSELNDAKPIAILRELRDAYDALHPDTDGVATSSSYPSCNIAGHRPDSTTDSPHPLA
ncbi:hypothetical protein BJV74DRAFT_953286 [Russula compacta]|nr:hypothetical protein BJV74DRAFT_953286 [Russula compacta]